MHTNQAGCQGKTEQLFCWEIYAAIFLRNKTTIYIDVPPDRFLFYCAPGTSRAPGSRSKKNWRARIFYLRDQLPATVLNLRENIVLRRFLVEKTQKKIRLFCQKKSHLKKDIRNVFFSSEYTVKATSVHYPGCLSLSMMVNTTKYLQISTNQILWSLVYKHSRRLTWEL